MQDKDIFVVAARRSPFGKYLGSLASKDPVELASTVARACMEQAGLKEGGLLDHIFVGNCIQATFTSPSTNGRQISLALGLENFSVSIDTACCSPLTGLRLAGWGMESGRIGTSLLLGIEMMSRTPHLLRELRSGVRAGATQLQDPIYPIEYVGYTSVAVDASDGAEKYGISKVMLDAWALGSQQKWARAEKAGRFSDEIVPIPVKTRKGGFLFDRDEFPRPTSTFARLQMLPPIFGSKTTTPGNAPGLNDGAAAMIVARGDRIGKEGWKPLARIIAAEGHAGEPDGISWVPGMAIKKALDAAKMSIRDIDLIEINEAFAAMPLVSTRVVAGDDEALWLSLLERTNTNGGAIAIGHPVGASGLRILMTLIYELRRRGGGRGVAAICGGLSQSEAVIVEVPSP
jgi:acetyl-CoA C-acetyltransferase